MNIKLFLLNSSLIFTVPYIWFPFLSAVNFFPSIFVKISDLIFPIWRSFKVNDNKTASYIWPENELKRSQDLEPAYHDAGQFYFLRVNKFLIQKKLIMKNNSIIEIPESKVQDIDNLEDWKLAEIKYNLNRS